MANNDNQYKDDKWDNHYPVITDTTKSSKPLTIKEAISIVLEDLHHRIPKTNTEGFLAEPKVYEAVNRLLKHIQK